MEETYRIGNIELRKGLTFPIKDTPSKVYYEIVFWYPNTYYNKESEFIYVKETNNYYKEEFPNFRISADCFKHPESCYTLATLCTNRYHDEEPDIKSVGSRPFRLSEEDKKDFLEVIDHIYKIWGTLYSQSDDYLID